MSILFIRVSKPYYSTLRPITHFYKSLLFTNNECLLIRILSAIIIKRDRKKSQLHQIVQTNELPDIQINELQNQPELYMNQQNQTPRRVL